MGFINQLLLGASLVPSILSQVTVTPGQSQNNPTYKFAVPSSSTVSTSSTGALYISISAPSNIQWVGLGTGTDMGGSTMILIYADGSGNITLSGRSARGEVQPLLDSTTQAGLTLLAGSAVAADGSMVANIKCTSFTLQGSSMSASEWIFASRQGSALNSKSTSATLQQHNGQHAAFTADLTQASIAQDANPFVASAANPSSSAGTGTASGATPSSTGTSGGSTSGGSTSGGSTSGGATIIVSSAQKERENYKKAHGIVMGITVVLLFPIGAMFMRLVGSPWVHGALQLFSLAALIVGFGLGVKLAQLTDKLFESDGRTHTIFGTVLLALFLIQPVLGLFHHTAYKKHQTRTPVSHSHIWFGRIIMALAIINGGLGLKLAANTTGGKIAYGVVAGVIALAYVVVVVLRRKGNGEGRRVGFNGLAGQPRKDGRIHSENSVEMR